MSPEGRLVWTKILLLLGLALTSFGLTLGLASYVVPLWYVYNITGTQGSTWVQMSRSRGIFQECLLDRTQTAFVPSPYVLKDNCIENDLGQYPQTNQGGPSYLMNIRLRLGQLILHGISLGFALILFILGQGIFFKWCGEESDSIYYLHWRLAFGLILLLTFLVMVASPSIGTALAYIESNPSYNTPSLPYNQANNNNIQFSWGSMYILAWISAGCYLLAAILFLITVCIGSRLEEDKYKPGILSLDNFGFTGNVKNGIHPLFFTPSSATVFGSEHGYVVPNDTKSPGLLPRYIIS